MVETEAVQTCSLDFIVQRLDALFAPWDRTDAPGLAIGVSFAGKPVYRRGFGMASLEFGVAVTPATGMRIGSTSKHFACLLALLLVEDGLLSIDAPVGTYLPELSGPAGLPTLRQLMQHRGGTRCHLDVGFLSHGAGIPPKGHALATLARQSRGNFAPGEAMIYSNGGYHLLSLAIQRAGGAPFEQQLKERLFLPLGMNNTASVPSDHAITPGMATMHVSVPGGGWQRGIFPSEEVLGEGAIVSTVDDMLRWMAHLRAKDKFGSSQSWAELVSPPMSTDGITGAYALGLMLDEYRGLRVARHSGAMRGATSEMIVLTDQALDIVVLSNGAPGADPSWLAEQVIEIVLANSLGDLDPRVAATPYHMLLGDWYSPDDGMIYSLAELDEQLRLELGKAAPFAVPLIWKHGKAIAKSNTWAIAVDLDRALTTDELVVTFCGRSIHLVRADPQAPPPSAFAAAVTGRFYSADAGATCTITNTDGRVAITLSDGFGTVACDLACIGERLAYTSAPPPAIWHWASLLFDIADGRATGFQMNSMRTRHLEFRRI